MDIFNEDYIINGFSEKIRKRLNAIYGFMDPISLCATIKYKYPSESEANLFGDINHANELDRTLLHEIIHLYQFTSTSYGHYYLVTRMFQAYCVAEIINLLKNKYGVTIQFPLAKVIDKLRPAEYYSDLWNCVWYYRLIESIFIFLDSDATDIARGDTNNLIPISIAFPAIEKALVNYHSISGHSYVNVPLNWNLRDSLNSELIILSHKITADIDVHAILESWAQIGEYIYQDIDAKSFMNRFNSEISHKSIQYILPLAYAYKNFMNNLDFYDFRNNYMAICDLALNPHIMPYHSHLRGEGFF